MYILAGCWSIYVKPSGTQIIQRPLPNIKSKHQKQTELQPSKFSIMLQKHKLLTVLMLALASTLLIFTACEDDEDDDLVNEGTVTDIDGNVYSTVQIGDQVWMAENLKTTTYNDGTSIDLVTDDTDWENNTTGAYCWYDNDEAQ